jgi:hypothetical protein
MKTFLLMTCAALGLQLGCGGDGGGGGTTPTGGQSGNSGPFSSGVEGSKKVSALTPQERQTFCAAEEKFFKANPAVATSACKLLAFLPVAFAMPKSDAEARTLCQQAYDQCLAHPETAKCDQQPTTCSATVSQAEACTSAAPAWFVSSTATLPSCATLKLSDLDSASSGGLMDPPPPAACKALDDLGCEGLDRTN